MTRHCTNWLLARTLGQALGVSEQAVHPWRNQDRGMKADEARRVKELKLENTRRKKTVADQALDLAIMQDASCYLGELKPGGKEVRCDARATTA